MDGCGLGSKTKYSYSTNIRHTSVNPENSDFRVSAQTDNQRLNNCGLLHFVKIINYVISLKGNSVICFFFFKVKKIRYHQSDLR